jgi:hypothetical protein
LIIECSHNETREQERTCRFSGELPEKFDCLPENLLLTVVNNNHKHKHITMRSVNKNASGDQSNCSSNMSGSITLANVIGDKNYLVIECSHNEKREQEHTDRFSGELPENLLLTVVNNNHKHKHKHKIKIKTLQNHGTSKEEC